MFGTVLALMLLEKEVCKIDKFESFQLEKSKVSVKLETKYEITKYEIMIELGKVYQNTISFQLRLNFRTFNDLSDFNEIFRTGSFQLRW